MSKKGLKLYLGSIMAVGYSDGTFTAEHTFFLTEAQNRLSAEIEGTLLAGRRWPSAAGWTDHGVVIRELSDYWISRGWVVPDPDELRKQDTLNEKDG